MNPFISQESFKLKVLEIKKTTHKIDTSNIPEDGVIVGDYETVTRSFLIEQQKKKSMYDVPYLDNILFGELTSRSRDLFLYVLNHAPQDLDYINLKQSIVCRNIRMSKPTLISAIKELSDVGVICRKSQSEYWINPYYIFRGNRVKFYQENYPNKIEKLN